MGEPNEATLLIKAYFRMLEKEEERDWRQLSNAISARNNLDQVAWIIFGIFWTVNILLLIGLFGSGVGQQLSREWVLPIVGIVFCIMWCLVQRRAMAYLKYYEDIVQTIELSLRITRDKAISVCINRSGAKSTSGRGYISARTVMTAYYVCATVVWCLILALAPWEG